MLWRVTTRSLIFFFLIFRRPPISPLFPSTALFRSRRRARATSAPPRARSGRSGSRGRAARTRRPPARSRRPRGRRRGPARSEEHTSELQSRQYLVCRLLLEKKKHITRRNQTLTHDH